MTLRTLKDKLHFYLKLYARGQQIEFSDAEEFELLMEGLSKVMKELGKFTIATYVPTSSTPTKRVDLPTTFGWVKGVKYEGEDIASANYEIGYNGVFYIQFQEDIIPSNLEVIYYPLPPQMLTQWALESASSTNAVVTHIFADTYTIPLPDYYLMAVVYAAISLVFPQIEPIFMKEMSLLRSTIEKVDKKENPTQIWRI